MAVELNFRVPVLIKGKSLWLEPLHISQKTDESGNYFIDEKDITCKSPDGYPTETIVVTISGETLENLQANN